MRDLSVYHKATYRDPADPATAPAAPAPEAADTPAAVSLTTGVTPSIVSAQPEKGSSGRNHSLPWRTAKAIGEETIPSVEWLLAPYLARGVIAELVGSVKRAGKTTLALRWAKAILDGGNFWDEETARGPVIWLAEDSPSVFLEARKRAGLVDYPDFHYLLRTEVLGITWAVLCPQVIQKCGEVGAVLLVVDTFSKWASLRKDAENLAGEADEALEHILPALNKRVAVLCVRHARKSEGGVGEAGRGSSAFTGGVDVSLLLTRTPGGSGCENRRQLEGISRLGEVPTRVLELRGHDYVCMGSEGTIAVEDAKQAVLEALPMSGSEEGLTLPDLCSETGKPRTTIQVALDQLLGTRDVASEGSGKRGSPFRYVKFLSARTPSLCLAETNPLSESYPGDGHRAHP